MITWSSVSQPSAVIDISENIIFDVIIAYYSVTKTINMDELTL